MADIFDVIADGTRRDILRLLLDRASAGERGTSVSHIVHELGVSQPTVSKHLKVLRDAHLVSVREEGQHRYYSLSAAPLDEVDDWLDPVPRTRPTRTPSPSRVCPTRRHTPPMWSAGPRHPPSTPSRARSRSFPDADAAGLERCVAGPCGGTATRPTRTTTARMPTHQASAIHAGSSIGVPMSSDRIVSMIGVTGWLSAIHCSHDGIVSTGTKALER